MTHRMLAGMVAGGKVAPRFYKKRVYADAAGLGAPPKHALHVARRSPWGRETGGRVPGGAGSLGYPLYVNGHLYQEPVTISHVPGPVGNYYDVPAGLGDVDPSLGAYAAYAPQLPPLSADDLPGSERASLPPDATPAWARTLRTIYNFVAPVTGAAAIYHGYKRNDSIGWALWWGLMGAAVPVITLPIALAQGFGKKKGMTPNRRRRRRRNPAAGQSLDVAINKAIDQARYADAPRYLTKSGATYFVEWSPTRDAVRVSRTDSVEAVKRRWQEKHR